MDNVTETIDAYGGFHDAKVMAISWSSSRSVVEMELQDAHANFLDLPEYHGLESARIQFKDVKPSSMTLSLEPAPVRIFDTKIYRSGFCYDVKIAFSPGGRVCFQCEDIEIIIAPVST